MLYSPTDRPDDTLALLLSLVLARSRFHSLCCAALFCFFSLCCLTLSAFYLIRITQINKHIKIYAEDRNQTESRKKGEKESFAAKEILSAIVFPSRFEILFRMHFFHHHFIFHTTIRTFISSNFILCLFLCLDYNL